MVQVLSREMGSAFGITETGNVAVQRRTSVSVEMSDTTELDQKTTYQLHINYIHLNFHSN